MIQSLTSLPEHVVTLKVFPTEGTEGPTGSKLLLIKRRQGTYAKPLFCGALNDILDVQIERNSFNENTCYWPHWLPILTTASFQKKDLRPRVGSNHQPFG